MNWDAVLFLFLYSWTIGLGASLFLACLQWPLVRLFSAFQTASRYTSGFWFVWGLLPLLFGISLALIAVASGWLSAWGWLADHCLEHPGHPHLCLNHIAGNPPGRVFLGGVAVAILMTVVVTLRVYLPLRRFRYGIRTLPSRIDPTGIVRLGTRMPLAFAVGVLRPRCYLSQGLIERLDETQLAIVQTHEMAHIRRADPLRLLLLRWCENWLPGVSYLREKWQAASEIECDRACLEMGYEPSQVASTILRLQRENGVVAAEIGLAYASSSGLVLRDRIESLLRQKRANGAGPLLLLIALSIFLAGSAVFEIHHALETVLGWLT